MEPACSMATVPEKSKAWDSPTGTVMEMEKAMASVKAPATSKATVRATDWPRATPTA